MIVLLNKTILNARRSLFFSQNKKPSGLISNFVFTIIIRVNNPVRLISRGYMFQDPCNICSDLGVDGWSLRRAAGFRTEGDDADEVISGPSVQALHLH